MNKFTKFLRNSIALFLLALAFVFIYLYASGKFQAQPSANEHRENEFVVENTAESNTNATQKPSLSATQAFVASLSQNGEGTKDYTAFDKKTSRLVVSDIKYLNLKSDFSLSNRTVSIPTRLKDENYETYTTVLEGSEMPRPQIELYDGNIIVDRANKLELYMPDGTKISDNFTLSPIYRRDSNGRALFFDTDKYYIIADGMLTETEYAANDDSRVMDFENSVTFASENNGNYFESDSETGLFALFNQAGERLTKYEFSKIYAYSEGLAAAMRVDGSIVYIDVNGNVVFGETVLLKNKSDWYENRYYRLPDTMGNESVGFLYFDNGLVLAREIRADFEHTERIYSDKTSVLKPDGSDFDLPNYYNAVSCSDGVIVCERDGYYGVFSKDKKWVLHPKYDSISPYFEGLSVVEEDGKYGVFDTKGNEIIPIIFDYISTVSGARLVLYSNDCGFVLLEKENITK